MSNRSLQYDFLFWPEGLHVSSPRISFRPGIERSSLVDINSQSPKLVS